MQGGAGEIYYFFNRSLISVSNTISTGGVGAGGAASASATASAFFPCFNSFTDSIDCPDHHKYYECDNKEIDDSLDEVPVHDGNLSGLFRGFSNHYFKISKTHSSQEHSYQGHDNLFTSD